MTKLAWFVVVIGGHRSERFGEGAFEQGLYSYNSFDVGRCQNGIIESVERTLQFRRGNNGNFCPRPFDSNFANLVSVENRFESYR